MLDPSQVPVRTYFLHRLNNDLFIFSVRWFLFISGVIAVIVYFKYIHKK